MALFVLGDKQRARPIEIDSGVDSLATNRHQPERGGGLYVRALQGVINDAGDERANADALLGGSSSKALGESILEGDRSSHTQSVSLMNIYVIINHTFITQEDPTIASGTIAPSSSYRYTASTVWFRDGSK